MLEGSNRGLDVLSSRLSPVRIAWVAKLVADVRAWLQCWTFAEAGSYDLEVRRLDPCGSDTDELEPLLPNTGPLRLFIPQLSVLPSWKGDDKLAIMAAIELSLSKS